jgi:hypothetical protein
MRRRDHLWTVALGERPEEPPTAERLPADTLGDLVLADIQRAALLGGLPGRGERALALQLAGVSLGQERPRLVEVGVDERSRGGCEHHRPGGATVTLCDA